MALSVKVLYPFSAAREGIGDFRRWMKIDFFSSKIRSRMPIIIISGQKYTQKHHKKLTIREGQRLQSAWPENVRLFLRLASTIHGKSFNNEIKTICEKKVEKLLLVSPQTLQTAQVVITFYFVKTKLQMEVEITVQNVIKALYIKNTKITIFTKIHIGQDLISGKYRSTRTNQSHQLFSFFSLSLLL